MNDSIKKDILSLLKSAIDILESEEEGDLLELQELSNHVIHNASIFQDEDSISMALLIYSAYKIFARGKDKNRIYSNLTPVLKQAKADLARDNLESFRKRVKNGFKIIMTIDSEASIYLEELLDKAKLKKGAKIYEHGISIARVAEILGISLWELSSYIGRTNLPEYKTGADMEKRIQLARQIFGLK